MHHFLRYNELHEHTYLLSKNGEGQKRANTLQFWYFFLIRRRFKKDKYFLNRRRTREETRSLAAGWVQGVDFLFERTREVHALESSIVNWWGRWACYPGLPSTRRAGPFATDFTPFSTLCSTLPYLMLCTHVQLIHIDVWVASVLFARWLRGRGGQAKAKCLASERRSGHRRADWTTRFSRGWWVGIRIESARNEQTYDSPSRNIFSPPPPPPTLSLLNHQ